MNKENFFKFLLRLSLEKGNKEAGNILRGVGTIYI